MKVMKIGGGCLRDAAQITHTLDMMAAYGAGNILVISALHGVTDMLLRGALEALEAEARIPAIIAQVRDTHVRIAQHIIPDSGEFMHYQEALADSLHKLERLYYGLNFTNELSPRNRDSISSVGERLAVELLVMALQFRKVRARALKPEEIGLVTNGKFGDAAANLVKTAKNFKKTVEPLLDGERLVLIPGFYGVSDGGEITTFGRGGSDYAAAVIAAALETEALELWKNTAGFMSADPALVSEAALIPELSYEEAAELAYFGAKIVHPRTVDPLRRRGIPILIKDIQRLEAPGSVIASSSPIPEQTIKSVAHGAEIGLLKVYSASVGARPGILARITSQLAKDGINITSVVTSQTCITLLLASQDMDASHAALKALKPKPYARLERLEHLALIGIVGQGLQQRKGIAAKCFTAVAKSGVNVEMISFGPSRVALYFLVRHAELQAAVQSIHETFFKAVSACQTSGIT
jgi:aspartate kinase